jgi:hypothetical protein
MNRNVIYWGCALVFLIGVYVVGRSHALFALFGVLLGSLATVWCVYSGLWHWNELPPSERTWTVYGALAGPTFLLTALAGIVRNAPPDLLGPSDYRGFAGLYVAILVYSLVLAGVTEAARKARSSPSPDNRSATDL